VYSVNTYLCAEVRDIKGKVEALRALAIRRKDREMQVWTSVIRTRADYEIGLRSKALEKASKHQVPIGGKLTKERALKESGKPPTP
jgi:hypothetical protein